eukprot:2026478-Pleurochrysis_carterae.AAC.3
MLRQVPACMQARERTRSTGVLGKAPGLFHRFKAALSCVRERLWLTRENGGRLGQGARVVDKGKVEGLKRLCPLVGLRVRRWASPPPRAGAAACRSGCGSQGPSPTRRKFSDRSSG